jgi:hypothetical protein
MRDLTKSLMSFSWAMMLFGARQAQALLARPGGQSGDPAGAFQAVTRAAEEQLTGPLQELFRAGDTAQRGLVDILPRGAAPGQGDATRASSQGLLRDSLAGSAPAGSPGTAGQAGGSTHLVLGEGLAAGMGDFSLSEETQRYCFPNLLAQQMGVGFAQPLVEAPGIGIAVGFPGLGASVPRLMQTTALEQFPPPRPFSNLSVPGLKVADVLTLRPAPPLIRRDDEKQTAVNLLLGLPDLLRGGAGPLPTPLELALRQHPLCIILELGYYDFLEPAVTGDVGRLPDVDTLAGQFDRILAPMADRKVEILVLTVPDPTDTAHFSTAEAAARCLRVKPEVLDRAYRLAGDSLVTVNGLLQMAWQIQTGRFEALQPGHVLGGEAAQAVRDRVGALNARLLDMAARRGAVVYDLHDLFCRVRREGVLVGSRRLTADYLGGFYSLNGYYPGPTGQALIAADLVECVNRTHGTTFSPPDLALILRADPVADYRPAEGPALSLEQVRGLAPAAARLGGRRGPAVPDDVPAAAPAAAPSAAAPSQQPLRLPPGLEQVLPLNKSLSYLGDALRPVHCQDERESRYGSCGKLLFGGLAMLGSHLCGSLHIRFTPPADQLTHFEVDWGEGLDGEDGVLSAPQYFRLMVPRPRVLHWPGTVVSGDLNLETGDVSNLDVQVQMDNPALALLIKVNPGFPKEPVRFPGPYGTAWAQFDQRPDGKLDFFFHGTTFIPLGSGTRFPLAFGSAGMPASVPAGGTALHPQLHFTTAECGAAAGATNVPEFPCNTVQEFTLFSHNTSFGDFFHLNVPELGKAQGRSQLLGRLQVQFGERFGGSVPVAVSTLPPGGMLIRSEDSPVAELFPGRLPGGLVGHDEFLRFPLRTYFLDAVSFVDDPFDLAVGAVDLRTGAVLGELTHRGFIDQNLFFALVRVEPRTPQSSFFFRGPASFERGSDGGLVYRFNGTVHIPYPEGFKFPTPDLATHYLAGPGSALDPFLRVQAMGGGPPPRSGARGGADDVLASNGNRFSYRYAVPSAPAREKAAFEYTNHAQGAIFCLRALAWISFTNSRGRAAAGGEYDTVTFAGFGTWSKAPPDQLHVATVQVSTARDYPYVSIQIDGGLVSNVNTKPADDAATLP